MSEIQEIDVFVKPDGTVSFEVRGVKGRKCLDITKGIEELLGGNVTQRDMTEDYNQAEQEQADSIEQHP